MPLFCDPAWSPPGKCRELSWPMINAVYYPWWNVLTTIGVKLYKCRNCLFPCMVCPQRSNSFAILTLFPSCFPISDQPSITPSTDDRGRRISHYVIRLLTAGTNRYRTLAGLLLYTILALRSIWNGGLQTGPECLVGWGGLSCRTA